MNPGTADVVVVGAGIVGVCAAAELAERGAKVVLLEKESGPAREGSGRAQGSLRVQGRHGSELALAREALDRWHAAAQDGDFELVRGGNLYLQTRPEEATLLTALVDEARRVGFDSVELLTPDQVREHVPAATGDFLGAMWSPTDAQCQPDQGTAHFAARAERHGADLRYGAKATRLIETGGRIRGVDTANGPIHAGAVVLAGGVWTPYLARTVGLRVPIMPVVMSELETEPVEPLFAATLRAFGFGARQRPNGRVVVSAGLNARVRHGVSLSDLDGLRHWAPRAWSFRKSIGLRLDWRRIGQQIRHRKVIHPALIPDTSPEPTVDLPLVDASLARLATVIPALRTARRARSWGGLVDMTPDGLPIIDAPGPAGLVTITGLCGHGFTLGPALGATAADLATTGRTERDLTAFTLNRFDGKVAQPQLLI